MQDTAVQVPTTYFLRPGRANTETTLEIAGRRAQELGIKTIVMATSRGETPLLAARVLRGYRLVAVTGPAGFGEPNRPRLPAETRARLEKEGVLVHAGTDPFGALGRAVRRQFSTVETEDIIAQTLRIIGQGMKVVCEVAMMAADAGLISTQEDVIAIAGTGGGADMAVVMRPANTRDFFQIRIKEVLCKPRLEQPHAPPPPDVQADITGRPAS